MEEATQRAQYFSGTAPSTLFIPLSGGYAASMPGSAPVTVEQEIGRLAEEVAQMARALSDARQDNMRSSIQLSDAEKRFLDLSVRLTQAMEQHSSAGQVNGVR